MLVFKEWMATKDGVAKLQVMSNQVRSTTIYFSHFSGVPNYQFINLLGMLVLILTKQVKSEQRTRGVPDCQCFLLFFIVRVVRVLLGTISVHVRFSCITYILRILTLCNIYIDRAKGGSGGLAPQEYN